LLRLLHANRLAGGKSAPWYAGNNHAVVARLYFLGGPAQVTGTDIAEKENETVFAAGELLRMQLSLD
jgi:hypothetical protein